VKNFFLFYFKLPFPRFVFWLSAESTEARVKNGSEKKK
jgi:hypothetical protein